MEPWEQMVHEMKLDEEKKRMDQEKFDKLTDLTSKFVNRERS